MKTNWFGKGLAVGLTSLSIAVVLIMNKPDTPEVYCVFGVPVLMVLFMTMTEY